MLKKIFIALKCCLYNNYCFILQGLSDTEEFVVSKALNAVTCLAELGLLQKPALQELGSEIVPFLCHSVSFIITIAYSSMVYIFFIYPGILEKLGVANVLLNNDILKKKTDLVQDWELHALLFANSVWVHLCPTKL